MNDLKRVADHARNGPRTGITSSRPDRIQALRNAVSAGRGEADNLVDEDSRMPWFVFGETPMIDQYKI